MNGSPSLSTQTPGESRSQSFLSVVLSFYNEEAVIPELVGRLRKVLRSPEVSNWLRGYELVFVNDASTDRSRQLLMELAQGYEDIRVINMSRNFGVSTCVLAGMEMAKGDLIVYMDADLQDPPEVIPQMLAAKSAGQGFDVVHTVRLSRAGEPRIKLLVTRLGYFILKYVSTVDLQIEAGDFKLLSRRAVDQLIQLREKRPFLRGLVCWIGFPQTTIHYHREARGSGRTKFNVFSLQVIRNFFASALISFSDVPLQISSVLGVVVSLGALIYGGIVLMMKLKGVQPPPWSGLTVALMFLSGVQLLTLGLQALYISAIHAECKRRPNYIVESTFGFHNPPNGANPRESGKA